MNYFTGEDLIFYKDSDTGNIMSGGYIVDSILLKEGIHPMKTLNSRKSIDDYEKKHDLQFGGGNALSNVENNGVSSIFQNLAIPAGLFYHNQNGGINKDCINNNDLENNYHHGKPLSEDIHDKLYKLIEMTPTKKTKTQKNKTDKIKSKKISRKNI